MLERIYKGDPEAVCTIIAFGVAASIFIAFSWRALRMKPRQTDHLSHLPFSTPTPESRHEPTDRPPS